MLDGKINQGAGKAQAGKAQRVRLADELDRLQKRMAALRWYTRLECPGRTPRTLRRVKLNIH